MIWLNENSLMVWFRPQSLLTVLYHLMQRPVFRFVFIYLIFKNCILQMCFQQQSDKLVITEWNMAIQ